MQGIYIKYSEKSEIISSWNVREDFVEEVTFEFILPKWISFGATEMESKAASAAGNSRNKDLQIGNDGSRSGTSELHCIWFFDLFCF